MPMTFSIVTCTWNSEPFLEQSIASVLAQDYPNIEYIFVDGGSEDGTLERIQALGDRAKWVTGVRGGIAHAMNVGIKMATGDVVAHLHSDDYYLDALVLSDVAKAFTKTGTQWLFGRTKTDREGVLEIPGWAMPAYSRKRLLRGNFIAHPATFVRRSMFEQCGVFDESIKYAMDYDLWLRLSKKADPVFLDRWIAAFRSHSGSLSSANALAALADDHRVRCNHLGLNPLSRAYHHLIHAVRNRRALAMVQPQPTVKK